MIVLCDRQGGIRNICVSLLKRYANEKYRIVSDTRKNYKGKIFEFVENASISLEQIQDPKTPYHAPIFQTCPTPPPCKIAFTSSKKQKTPAKLHFVHKCN